MFFGALGTRVGFLFAGVITALFVVAMPAQSQHRAVPQVNRWKTRDPAGEVRLDANVLVYSASGEAHERIPLPAITAMSYDKLVEDPAGENLNRALEDVWARPAVDANDATMRGMYSGALALINGPFLFFHRSRYFVQITWEDNSPGGLVYKSVSMRLSGRDARELYAAVRAVAGLKQIGKDASVRAEDTVDPDQARIPQWRRLVFVEHPEYGGRAVAVLEPLPATLSPGSLEKTPAALVRVPTIRELLREETLGASRSCSSTAYVPGVAARQ